MWSENKIKDVEEVRLQTLNTFNTFSVFIVEFEHVTVWLGSNVLVVHISIFAIAKDPRVLKFDD